MTDMHLWNSPIARVRALLAGVIVLGVALFVLTTTQATNAKQPPQHVGATGQSPSHVAPRAPAGPRGPITLTCGSGGGVIGATGPAGPQGPVGVSCAASANG